MKYMLRSVNVLNVFLLLLIAAFADYLYPLLTSDAQYIPPPPKAAIEEAQSGEEPLPPSVRSVVDYTIIAQKNLFSPQRSIANEIKEEKPAVVVRPELVLHGTMVTNGASYAFVDDVRSPKVTPGRGKRLKVLGMGDAIGGFMVKDIGDGRLTIAKGEQEIVFKMDEPGKKDASSALALPAPPYQRTYPYYRR